MELESSYLLPDGRRIEVYYDEDPEKPDFPEWLHVAVAHRKYQFGTDNDNFFSWEELIASIPEDAIKLPLYLFDHGGLSLSTTPFSCPWDSGQLGYVWIDKKEFLKEFCKSRLSKELRSKAGEHIQSAVKYLDAYVSGEVFGGILFASDGTEKDSCWGFFGSNHYESWLFNTFLTNEEIATLQKEG
jgi:hypothetical protein